MHSKVKLQKEKDKEILRKTNKPKTKKKEKHLTYGGKRKDKHYRRVVLDRSHVSKKSVELNISRVEREKKNTNLEFCIPQNCP